jgi:hypothetical protein
VGSEAEVLAVVDGLVEQHGDVVVVELVDDALAGAGTGDQSEGAQQSQLVGHGRGLHTDGVGELMNRARTLA